MISTPAALSVEHGNLLCTRRQESLRLPLQDIATITLESPRISLTAALLATLNEHGIALITCNARHIPNGQMLAYNTHSRLTDVLRAQIACSQPFRKRIWQRIVRGKIANQARVLQLLGRDPTSLAALVPRVLSGDTTNVEAQAARRYFALLFDDFRRGRNDAANAALNYGYAIVRAAVARDLTRYGFQPALGLHHANGLNAFNLADDLIEPFRPFVDAWVSQCVPLPAGSARLRKQDRATLTQVLQIGCLIERQRQRLLHAIRLCVQSLSSAVHDANDARLQLPELPDRVALVALD